ncbi:neprilysin-like [Rhipicephalus sanguineus]|uniref:neprilysin-like n=1 Tax=Rhipicephalus sanguineus TaxID=34632 RepID=UPI0020C50CD6|nr:neprilysin-like [Rhipicephalus sanguineus]
MSISGLQPPPPFLSSPGHPDIPWEQWIQAFKNYMIASGASDLPAIRRKAILLNCLGLEGQRIFQTLATTDDPCLMAASAAGGTLASSPSPDDFDHAIATLEGHFKSTVNVTAARHRFRRRTQAPERWLIAIRRGSERSAVDEDSVYARPLALMLLTRLLSDSGGVAAMRRLLWWGLVRELAPYASGSYLPTDSNALDRFCVRRVAAKLELAIRAVYLFRAVTPSVLSAVGNLTAHMRAALSRALRSSWLRDRTRSAALRKAASMGVTLGFPDRFSRESQLDAYFATLDDVRPDKSLSSWLALRRFLQEQLRQTEGDQVDLAVAYAHKVNAYYLSGNRVLVPAGIIQEPVYFHDAADAYNYGSLGQAVGHEMMHAFDTGGRKLDEDGKPWSWTATANREYEERLKCIRRSHVEEVVPALVVIGRAMARTRRVRSLESKQDGRAGRDVLSSHLSLTGAPVTVSSPVM